MTTTAPERHRQLAEYRARRDRLLAVVGPLTVSQRERLAAVNAQITALGG